MLTENDNWEIWRWTGSVLFLAAMLFTIFLVAEHDMKMVTVEGFVQDIEDQQGWAAGGNSLRRLAFLGCAGFGMLGLMMGQWGRFRWNVPMVLFMVYVAWTGASVSWSIDFGASVRRYVLMLCCVIGCIGLTRFVTIEQVLIATMIAMLGWLLVGISAELYFGAFRPHDLEHRFAGTIHPNLQAANLAMVFFAAFTMSRIRPKLKWLLYAIMFVVFAFLLMTKCRTVVGVLPLAFLIIWLTTQPMQKVAIGSLAGIWMASSAAFVFLVIGFDPISEFSEVLLLGRGEETGSSLTGRLPLWKDLSGYIRGRPLHGYGFGAFWTPNHIYDIAKSQEWVISEAHSSYIDAILQIGLIGVLLLLSVAVSTFIQAVVAFRQTGRPEYIFIIGGVFFCLCRGFTESGLSEPAGFSSPLFLVMAANSWNPPLKQNTISVSTKLNTRPELNLQGTAND